MAAAVQHSIVFDPGYSDKSYKLFELEEDVLQELLHADGRCAPADRASACAPPTFRRIGARARSVSVKGAAEEEAVLCTSDRTYTLRLAESSNMLLLVPGATLGTDGEKLSIAASAQEHFELVRAAPRTDRVRVMVSAAPYAGGAPLDAASTAQPPTFAQLESAAQCSRAELHAALMRSRAMEINGRYTILEPKYEQDIVDSVLNVLVEQEWPLDAVPVAACVTELSSYDAAAVRDGLRPPPHRPVPHVIPNPPHPGAPLPTRALGDTRDDVG